MARRAREASETGIYHIMIRGIDRQLIFNDDEDCERMLQILADVKDVSGCEIYAYCLMSNHGHFLIKAVKENAAQIFKRIGVKYVYWYNVKYNRVGHLFQDRFLSEPVNDDKYLLSVLRYIHQNPVKADICTEVSDYKWSSYREYTGKSSIIDTEFVYGLISRNEFPEFNKSEETGQYLEYKKPAYRINDERAKELIGEISQCGSFEEFTQMGLTDKRVFLKSFKKAGMSIGQISRLTGISRGIIERS